MTVAVTAALAGAAVPIVTNPSAAAATTAAAVFAAVRRELTKLMICPPQTSSGPSPDRVAGISHIESALPEC